MALSIQALHTQVTQLADQNGDATTGKLRGGVAANTEGSFQGLKLSNGARDSEKAFATEVLKHVSNVTLNQNEQAELFKSTSRFNKNNFVLQQTGHGESRLTGLKSDQLTLRDAKVLLDAVMRQQESVQVPPRPPKSDRLNFAATHQQVAPQVPPRPPKSDRLNFAAPHQQIAPQVPPRPVKSESLNNPLSKYDQQFIIDSGSGKSAEGIMLKAKSNDLQTQSVSFKQNAGNIADSLRGITFNSRVYIIGHCSPGSSSIVSDHKVRISAQDYAKGIAEAASQSKAEYKGKPLTVSVMACNGGSSSSVYVKNSQEALALRADNSHVDIVWPSSRGNGYGLLPQGSETLAQATRLQHFDPDNLHNSFAETLTKELSKLGIVAEVKGRTNVVNRTSQSKLEDVKSGADQFSKKVHGRHHAEGDKVGFIAQNGQINKVVYDYK